MFTEFNHLATAAHIMYAKEKQTSKNNSLSPSHTLCGLCHVRLVCYFIFAILITFLLASSTRSHPDPMALLYQGKNYITQTQHQYTHAHYKCLLFSFFFCEVAPPNCAMLLPLGGKQPKTQTSHHNNELNENYH